jgi:hypothetical protein
MKINIAFTSFVILVLMMFLFSYMLIFLNKDYLTPLIDIGTNEPTNTHPTEPTQTPPTVNPDGTKNYTVDLVWYTEMTFNLGGSHFSLSKYNTFTIGTILQEILMEIVNQLAEHVRDIGIIVVIFLAFIAIRKTYSRTEGINQNWKRKNENVK